MILRTLKSNSAVNFILFPLFAVIFWLKSLLKPEVYPFYRGETENLFYHPVAQLLQSSAFLQSLVSLLLIILMTFLILQINNRYSFIRVRTMLPAPLFIILIGGFTQLHTLHPVYFATVFYLVAIFRFFSAFGKVKPYTALFDAGIWLGVASLFYFNAIILLPAFVIGTGILTRETRWREFVILITGFFAPFILALGFAFYTDQFLELLKTFELNIVTPNSYLKGNIALQTFLGVLVLFTLLGSVKILQQYNTKKVSTRKFFTVFFFMFLFSVFSFVFVPATSQEMLIIIAIPVTFQISNFFVFLKSRFWGELLLSLLLIIVIALQFFS
jgi:hypothetical protein